MGKQTHVNRTLPDLWIIIIKRMADRTKFTARFSPVDEHHWTLEVEDA